jgi:AraC-like DNA-binding protein
MLARDTVSAVQTMKSPAHRAKERANCANSGGKQRSAAPRGPGDRLAPRQASRMSQKCNPWTLETPRSTARVCLNLAAHVKRSIRSFGGLRYHERNDAMYVEPLVADLKAQLNDSRPLDAEEAACTFWTRPDGQLCVQHVRSMQSAIYRPHSHQEYGIVVCLEGEVFKTQMGSTTTIGPGEVAMCNSCVDHASGYLAGTKGYEAVCIAVERGAMAAHVNGFQLPAVGETTGPVFSGKLASRVLHVCAHDIVRELRNRELGHKLVIEGLATRMLIETLRAWPRSHVGQSEIDPAPRLPRRDFIRAYDFMRWCKKDAFRVQHLCQFLSSSEERFTRLFMAATNSTPANFYNQLLLERSRDLLRDSGFAVKAISFELGFKTTSHFIVSFRRNFGITPQKYRQQYFGGLLSNEPVRAQLS